MDEFDEIVREFLVESYENLDQLDRDLVALEQEPDAHPLLQSIFRTIHTIKGTSGFLAFGNLEALTHAGEGLLARLRDGGLRLTQERTTGLLELVDAVRGLLASIEATGAEHDRDHTELVARLTALQEPVAEAEAIAVAGMNSARSRASSTSATGATGANGANGANGVVAAKQGAKATAKPAEKAAVKPAVKAAAKPAARPSRRASGLPAVNPAPQTAAESATDAAPTSPTDAAPTSAPETAGERRAGTRRKVVRRSAVKAAAARMKLPTSSGPATDVPLLGQILMERADLDIEDVAVAMLEQQLGDDRPLGEILVDHGQATPSQVREALAAQAEARSGSVSDSSLRVDVVLLDGLMRLVGELVLTRNQIVATAATQADPAMLRSSQRLNLLVSELQAGVMKTRMQPIDTVWNKLPRLVRDLSVACGREVKIELEGRDTELDKTILEAIKDPLTHVVRNAVDHGIESPEDRVAAGKAAEGVLHLRAFHEGGQVNIEISDDGAGIDPAQVAAKALERGLVTAEQLRTMGVREMINLIFLPGLSTAAKVTNVSGRGVGMDVVRTNIEKIGGTVDVSSEIGVGTTLRIKIPLTLAIIPALTVECAGERYAVPQVSLEELLCLEGEQARTGVEYLSGAPVFRLRGNLLPLVWLDHVLDLTAAPHVDDAVYILVLQAEGRRFGLVVDRVLNTEEIVVKPLSRQLKGIGTYAGATILGDGRVALILDVRALARRAHVVRDSDASADLSRASAAQAGLDGPEPLLVVAVGDRRIGVPLSMVTRLEEIPVSRIERVGQREVVQYRGQLLPLGRLSTILGVQSPYEPTGQADQLQVIVYTQGRRSVGLVVDAVVDIATEAPKSRSDASDYGVSGVVVVQELVTELLDMEQAIMAADPRFFDAVAAAGGADVSPYETYAEIGA
ncbi:MAG: two-component system, chemotaxis family, sensor kinase CheA [Actinomycetota bacterium]|nr:two-component system, chemotaxis family, sensor kinase CheA [Actinomycetota bacterium]